MKPTRWLLFVLVAAGLFASGPLLSEPDQINLKSPSRDPAKLREQVYLLQDLALAGDRQAASKLDKWDRRRKGLVDLYFKIAASEKEATARGDHETMGLIGLAYVRGDGGMPQIVDHERLLKQLYGPASVSRSEATQDPNVIRRQQALREWEARKADDPDVREFLEKLDELQDERVSAG